MENQNSYRGSLRNMSGNRSMPSNVPTRDYHVTEEELYERRRQQELRRQIQMKEQELEQSSSRPGQRFGIHTWQQPQKVEETGSKSRFDRDRTPPQRIHGSSRSPLRQKSQSRSPRRASQDRNSSGSPLRQKSGSPSRVYLPPLNTSQNDYLVQLQNDNNSLQRRLNLVLQELDRINRDRSNLGQKFKVGDAEISRLSCLLKDSEEKDNKINRDLQLQLNMEREKNRDAKLRIADIDKNRNNAISKLRVLQGQRDRFIVDNDDLSKDFQRKMGMVKALESEIYQGHDRVQKCIDEIERLQRAEIADNAHFNDVQLCLNRLRGERDELLRKLSNLNRTYDNCVQEIQREREQISLHHKHHSKLLIAKQLFQAIETMQLSRKQDAINEFFTYCRFDQKCHSTLKTFVEVLDRLGKFKLKIAIKQWHQKAFKPIEVIDQQFELVSKLQSQKLMTRMFNRWRRTFLGLQDCYGHKNKALQAIWDAKAKDVKKDVLRAFTIWREMSNFAKLRERKLKFQVWKCFTARTSNAFNKWIRYGQEMDGQMRLHLVAKSFAHYQLKQITFAQLKTSTHEKKRKRLNRLRSYYRAWQESNAYNKYMYNQNVSVMQLRKAFNGSLMKMVWDALRHNKEVEKQELMMSALESETNPAIDELNSHIKEKTNSADRSNKTRSFNTCQRMMKAWLGSYFCFWREMTEKKQHGVNVSIKQLIIRAYKTRLLTAWATWKKGNQHKDVVEQQTFFEEQGEQQTALQSEAEELGKQIQQAKVELDRSGRKAMNRSLVIWNRRMQQNGIRGWYDNVFQMKRKEAVVDNAVITKMRQRLLKQAFLTFKSEAQKMTQQIKNENRAQQMVISKYNLRSKRMIFNAMLAYKTTFQKSQHSMAVLFNKIELWRQKRAFKTWMENTHAKIQDLLILETDEQAGQLNELMQMSKDLERQHQEADQSNKQMERRLRKNCERVMANAFARSVNVRTFVWFEKWKNVVKDQKIKERIITGLLSRQRKYAAAFLFNAFKQNAEKDKIKNQMGNSNQLSSDTTKALEAMNFQNMTYEQQHATLENQINKETREAEIAADRNARTFEFVVKLNDRNNYMHKKRACFLAWNDHTKRVKGFTRTLVHVINHTLWHQGFQNIKEFARDKHLTRRQDVELSRIRKMFWRRNAGAAFSKWKEHEFQVTCFAIESSQKEKNLNEFEYKKQFEKTQQHNAEKYEKYLGSVNKHRVWQAWKKVIKMLKNHRNAQKNTLDAFGGYLQIRAVRKWIERVRTTQFARDRVAKYHQIKNRIYKKACFREMNSNYRRTKGFILKLSNMAKSKYNGQGLQQAFQTIKNFSLSKNGAGHKQKEVSVMNTFSIVHQLYLKKMLDYMSELRRKTQAQKEKETKQITMINHVWNRTTRRAFQKWKFKAQCEATVDDVNACGPIVEEVLEARLLGKACLDFLEKEGYTPKQINAFEELAEKRGMDKLRKAMGHWQAHVNGKPFDGNLMPIYLNRWKFYTKMRKVINYWLDFITVKEDPMKSNIKRFFDKWKYHFKNQDKFLNQESRETLLKRTIITQKKLNKAVEEEAETQDYIDHLNAQNDDLTDSYVRSQRLAFAMSRDNLRMTKFKVFSRLASNVHSDQAGEVANALAGAVSEIGVMKGHMAGLEEENNKKANENDELKEFTLDGLQMSKMYNVLEQECDKLKKQLADKAQTMQNLLDQNEKLSIKLRVVQEKVVKTAEQMQAMGGRSSSSRGFSGM